MLGTACAVAFADSLVEPDERESWCQTGGDTPSLAELLSHEPRLLAVMVGDRIATVVFSSSVSKKRLANLHLRTEHLGRQHSGLRHRDGVLSAVTDRRLRTRNDTKMDLQLGAPSKVKS